MRKMKSMYTFDWQGYSGYGFSGYEKSMDRVGVTQGQAGMDTPRLGKAGSDDRKLSVQGSKKQ